MQLKFIIVTSGDGFILLLVPCLPIIKAWKWTEETRPKLRLKNKMLISQIGRDFYYILQYRNSISGPIARAVFFFLLLLSSPK